MLLLIDDENFLAEKDLDWCKKNFPATEEAVESQETTEPPRKKVPRKKPAEVQCTETETSAKQSDHPYEQFLASQKKREVEWKSARESKRAKVAESSAPAMVTNSSVRPSLQDDVTVLRQQLATKTEVCRHLVNRLDAMEETNTKILSCQMQMQENLR